MGKTAKKAKPKVGKKASPASRHRVVQGWLPDDMAPACQSISRHVRDLGNTAVNLARVALSCFEWDSEAGRSVLRCPELLPLDGAQVLAAFNAAISAQNAKRSLKSKGRAAAAKELAGEKEAEGGLESEEASVEAFEPKLLPLLDKGNEAPSRVILDATLFDSVVRGWADGLDPGGRSAYSRLPSWLANHEVQRVRRMFLTWLSSCKAFKASGGAGWTGAPEMPGYAPRGKLPSFGMSLVHEQYRSRLPPLTNTHDMKLGEDKLMALLESERLAWSEFDLLAFVQRLLEARRGDRAVDFEPKQVRIIPDPKGTRIHVVCSTPDVHPEGSFLWELARRHPDEWAKRRSDVDLMSAWVRELSSSQTWSPELARDSDPAAWMSRSFGALGIDPGVSNVACVASTSGSRALVFSAAGIERELAKKDAQIDSLISRLTPDRVRELDAKRETAKALGQAFPLSSRIERRTLVKAVHADLSLLDLYRSRASFVGEMAHKLSSQIAGHAKREGAAVVFLSRTKGLKSESGLGRKMERRSHRLPHNLLAQMLRWKLWEAGVFLLETEESWTSQSSFADGDELPAHPEGARQTKEEARRAQSKSEKAKPKDQPQTKTETKEKEKDKKETETMPETPARAFSGIRGAPGNLRHRFSRQWPNSAPGPQPNRHRRQVVHADANAALNAVRKASPAFACTSRVSLGHEIWILSQSSWRAHVPLAQRREEQGLRLLERRRRIGPRGPASFLEGTFSNPPRIDRAISPVENPHFDS